MPQTQAKIDRVASQSLWLVAITTVGILLGFAISAATARYLGTTAFDDFAVACACLGMCSTIAEAGVGKFAFKVLPRFSIRHQWHAWSGYLRFSFGLTLVICVVLMAGFAFLDWQLDYTRFTASQRFAIAFLPAAAICGIASDFAMANGATTLGMIIIRIVVPTTTLSLIVAVELAMGELTSRVAVLCYGAGAALGAVASLFAVAKTIDNEVWRRSPIYQFAPWLRECLYYALSAFLAASSIRLMLVTLKLLAIDEVQISHFAVASEAGCLVLLLSKSTDKLFQPAISIMIARPDLNYGNQLRAKRYRFIGGACVLFMTGVLLFGEDVLSIFGEEFIEAYDTLWIVAVGACVMTLFSLSPTFLNFQGQSRFVLTLYGANAIVIVLLTVLLAPKFGAVGAGIAFMIPSAASSTVFYFVAARGYQQLSRDNVAKLNDSVVP